VGLEFQRSYSSASLRGVGRDAHRVVREVLSGPGTDSRHTAEA
jgi:putative flavoprotein involved in K+ transport